VLALLCAELLDRTVVMAFEPETIRRVRDLAPGARTALLVGRRSAQPSEIFEEACALGVSHLGLHHGLIDRSVVVAAHRAGLRLGAFTVNEAGDIERVASAGVDVIISDRPDVAVRTVRR
jgi:glycerophosphoryl diester phosphodiesterase